MDRDRRWEKIKHCYETFIGNGEITDLEPSEYLTSEYEKENHRVAFSIPKDRFVITGNPRNDRLYNAHTPTKSPIKTILYTPTFRERGDGPGNHTRVLLHPEIEEIDMIEI